MNLKLIIHTNSVLVIILSIIIGLCSLIALFLKEDAALAGFAITAAIGVIFGTLTFFATANRTRKDLSFKDGVFLVTFTWLEVTLLFSLPYFLSGAIPSFVDAYFETVSGFTTTGATILQDIELLPKSLLFWRSLTQWIGGMGIIVLTVAILPLLGIGGMSLFQAEVPGLSVDKLAPKIAATAKILWTIYLILTIICSVFLIISGLSLFEAVTLSFSVIATGGFSIYNDSVAHFQSHAVDIIVILFMLLASINFSLLFWGYKLNFKRIMINSEFRFYIAIIFLMFATITSFLYYSNYSTDNILILSKKVLFEIVSLITTSGFGIDDYILWPYFAQTILLLTFFIGGCSGSTSGGVKAIRVLMILKQIINESRYLIYPSGVFGLKINKRVLLKNSVFSVFGFIFAYFFTVLFVSILFTASGYDLVTSFTSGLGFVGNIGPIFGDTIGSSGNFYEIPNHLKIISSLAMIAGRLELYTFFLIFLPLFWKK